MFINPHPNIASGPEAPASSAVCKTNPFKVAAFKNEPFTLLACCCNNTKDPATLGEAIDVPEIELYAVSLDSYVEYTETPLPAISGLIRKSSVGPSLLKVAIVTLTKFPLESIFASFAAATTKLFLDVECPVNLSNP